MNRSSWLLVVVALAGAGAALWSGTASNRRVALGGDARAAEAPLRPGDSGKVTLRFFRDPTAAPAIAAHDLDGQTVSSADWRGRVTLVNFWATWCGPCREEIPALIALQDKYRDRLQIIGISEDEGPVDLVRQFVAEHRINYPVVIATPDLERLFPGVGALPTTFVVDREARVVQKHLGMLAPALTELEVRALAGLPVNAAIEQVDRGQPIKLENAAQVTSIPGVDLVKLTPERRVAVLQKLNAEPCTCGCDLTVAKCRVDDPTCGISLPLARTIVKQIAEQR